MEFSSVNTIWVLLGAALVFFMQAGFAMVETGFTRAKNAGNIIMKNLMDFCLGTPIFWILGFGLMFGAGSFIGGYHGIASEANYGNGMLPDGVPFLHFLYFKLFSVLLPRQSFQALWRKELSLPLILYTAQLSVRLFTRLKLIGSGAAAGFPKWDSTILPVQRQYI